MRLVSFYGNEVVYTEDEKKIEYLKSRGFKEQEAPAESKTELPKKKEVKKNGRKRKVKPEGNI